MEKNFIRNKEQTEMFMKITHPIDKTVICLPSVFYCASSSLNKTIYTCACFSQLLLVF